MAIRIALRVPTLRRRTGKPPGDATPDWEFPTDAQPSAGRPRRGEREAEVTRRLLFRRRVTVLVLGAIFVGGTAAALFAEGGYLELRRLRGQRERLTAEVEAQRAEVAALGEEVRRLVEEPLARERIAREKLGLAREGEITFLLPGKRAGDCVEGQEPVEPRPRR